MRIASPILIAGPTASGKSRLAMDIAKRIDGVVINADSMQVYTELQILTARPSLADAETVPHRLYGHVSVAEPYSVGRWINDVAATLIDARGEGRRPVIVGGTGLYFRSLTKGLTEVPDVPAAVRSSWRERAATLTTEELHARLAQRSAAEATRVKPSDRNRILRALEVIDGTGRTLPEWQNEAAGSALVDMSNSTAIVVTPHRADLYDQINRRFLMMVKAGALGEARRIANQDYDPELPAMKSIGLSALLAHLSGEIELDEAIARAQTETRNFAKRQMTWFRNQMPDWQHLAPAEARSLLSDIA